MGNIEVNNITEDLKPTIQGEVEYSKSFREHPHSIFKNVFSGEWLHNGLNGKDLITNSI